MSDLPIPISSPKRSRGCLDDSLAALPRDCCTPVNFPGHDAKRCRGAQPGNLNALKHGFYLGGAHLRGTAPLKVADLESVSETIAYIRAFIRQTCETNLNTASLAEVSEATHSLALAGLALARLITLNNKLASSARASSDSRLKK